MTIAVPVEIDNLKIKDFTEAEREVYRVALEFGRTLMRQILETRDLQILTERDGERYRNKGLRTTCIKTVMGEVVYDRRVYQDLEAQDEKNGSCKSVYLLDEELAINKIGNISEGVCQLIGSSICENSYRATARQISEQTGQAISAQGVWDVVQALGEKQAARIRNCPQLYCASLIFSFPDLVIVCTHRKQ